MPELISSTSNPKIKHLIVLQKKASERRISGLMVIEGIRELKRAIAAGFCINTIYYCKSLLNDEFRGQDISKVIDAKNHIEITSNVFERLAYRGGSGGIIATAEQKNRTFDTIKLSKNPLIIVLESVEKPGNLGAILRTADAAGADAVIVCDPSADIHNPNVIRSSTGCIFTIPVVVTDSLDAYNWLIDQKIQIITTTPEAKKIYHETDMKKPLAIIMGTEANGLSDFWIRNSEKNIRIPMQGIADSLNVSVCAAIIVFEVLRQRCIG